MRGASTARGSARREKFTGALEVLERAHAELAVEEAAAGWLNRWPDGKVGVGERYVADLPATPNGDPVTAEAMLDALRTRRLPPEPRRPAGALRLTERGMINPCPLSRSWSRWADPRRHEPLLRPVYSARPTASRPCERSG